MANNLFDLQKADGRKDVSKCLCKIQQKFIKIGMLENGVEIWSEDGGRNWKEFDSVAVDCFYMVGCLVQAALASGLHKAEMVELKSHDDLMDYVCSKVNDCGLQSVAAGDEDLLWEMMEFATEHMANIY